MRLATTPVAHALHRSALVVALAAACADEEQDPPADPSPRALVDVESWVRAEGEIPEPFRPLPDMRIACDPVDGFGPEPFGGVSVFEVDTGYCNWGTFEQPLLDDIVEGELVRPRLWHFELTSPVPAEGYAAFAIDDEVVWEYRVAIPTPGALASEGFVAERDIPAGTRVLFHVHNHGLNSWNVVDVSAEPAPQE
jgi:hypothetical protein